MDILPFFKGPAYGLGFLAAGLVLAIMIVPYIVSVSREVLFGGAARINVKRRWAWAPRVGKPRGRSWCRMHGQELLGSVLLSMARALGETMVVTMVIGNTPEDFGFSAVQPGYTIAAVIANEFYGGDGQPVLELAN